jgi:hypothetical protein
VLHDVQRNEAGRAGDQYCHARDYNAERLRTQGGVAITASQREGAGAAS